MRPGPVAVQRQRVSEDQTAAVADAVRWCVGCATRQQSMIVMVRHVDFDVVRGGEEGDPAVVAVSLT